MDSSPGLTLDATTSPRAAPAVVRGTIPEIDGLRGIAILMVMVHRLWPRVGAGAMGSVSELGWIGVDLFFVISGFLITGILLDTRTEPHYFRNFYARRALRIFPLYYLFIGVMLVVFPLLEHRPYLQTDYIAHSGSPLWYLFYLGNIPEGLLGLDTPYWLAPVWSLAIEEQFYLSFPWVVRALEPKRLTRLLLALLLVAPVVRIVTMSIAPDQERVQYMFTLCRLDTLAAGCLIAIFARHASLRTRIVDRALQIAVGLAVVVGMVSGLDRTTAFGRTFGYSVVAIGFAAVVLAVVRARGARWTAPLRSPTLRYFGKLCFGLYLLHRPAHTVTLATASRLGIDPDSPFLVPVAILVALAFASASWYAFERPVAALKRRFGSARHPGGLEATVPTSSKAPARALAVTLLVGIAFLSGCSAPGHLFGSGADDVYDAGASDCDCIGDDAGGDDSVPPDGGSPAGVILYPENRTHSPLPPAIVARIQAIAGAASRDAQVFAKIGDSMTAAPSFFYCYDGSFDLDTHAQLATTLDYFQHGHAGTTTPFSRDSVAAVGGTTTADVLAGTPCSLDAEVDAVNSRYAMVLMGTNDVRYGRSVDSFGTDLWTIVDRLRSKGVIPVLSTMPTMQGDPEAAARIPLFNRVIRAIAQGRSIPLVDFSRELASLPNQGISSDGIHPSVAPQGGCVLTAQGLQYGYNRRNLISLEALERVRLAMAGTASDPGAQVRAGSGHLSDPFVGSLPLVDLADTRAGDALLSQYTGCGAPAENGHEMVYRLDLTATTTIDAYIVDRGSTNVNVHVLAGTATGASCVAWGDSSVSTTVGPGPIYIAVDAPDTTSDGEFVLVVSAR